MKKLKVLFIVPKTKSMFGGRDNVPAHPHVGIAYLTSILKKAKHDVVIFDEGIEKNKDQLLKNIKKLKPDIIGITVFSYCYALAYETVFFLKKQTQIPLIMGGPHVSAVKEEVLKETDIDFALYGEGEVSFPEFLKEFKKEKSDYSKISGLIWKKGQKIIINPAPGWIKDLNRIPFPDYEAFDLKQYSCFQTKTLPILTSRGCPYGCIYCSVKLSMGRGFRARTPENVLAEIQYWYKKGFNSFDINDDCFTLDLERAKKICEGIIENKMKIHFQLYNGIRVDRVDQELLKKLKEAGCTFIAYGCEAGNNKMLKIINKGITLEQVKKAVEMTNKTGIKNAVNFIIGHPQETYQDALDSIKFAQKLSANFVNFYNLVPYPGTESYQWAIKNAEFIYPKETFLKEISYRDNVPIFETKEFTKKEREKIMKMGFALYEKMVMRFRLGKSLGTIAYLLTRLPFLHTFLINLIMKDNIIRKLFFMLSAKSRA